MREIIVKHVGSQGVSGHKHLTKIDAPLLGAWRAAAKDPDDQVGKWLLYGAPAGIINQPLDPGILPDVSAPSDWQPDDLECDELSFRNYSGVEENGAAETEIMAQIEKDHP